MIWYGAFDGIVFRYVVVIWLEDRCLRGEGELGIEKILYLMVVVVS